jgi:hypothetical protein
VASQLVLIRAVAGMVPPGGSQINPETNAIQNMLLSRQGGRFKIEVFQNTPAAYHARPDLAEQLTQELSEVLKAGRGVVATEG